MNSRFVLLAATMAVMMWSCGNGATASAESGADSIAQLQQEAKDATATIVFAGDAMQHEAQLNAARRGDSYDYSGYFTAVEPYIKGADYAVVNLETTLGGKGYRGYPMFCSPDSYAEELKSAGFDMFLTANNHCLDSRDAGLRRTIEVLDKMGVDHVGTYANAAARAEALPLIKDINGFKIAFLNYTYGTNGITIQGDVVVDYINRDKIRSDLAKAREAGAELLCVNMHWGDEYRLLPNAYEKEWAEFLVNEGVDLIIGGHPHVIQPLEMRRADKHDKDVLLVYSMGNFISGMKKTDTQGGIMVRATLKRDDAGKAVVAEAEYLPVFVMRPGDGANRNYRLVVADSVGNARGFLHNAYDIFNKHNVRVPRSKDL